MRRMSALQVVLWTVTLYPSCMLLCQSTSVKPLSSETAGSTYTPHMSFDVAAIHESHSGNYSYYDYPPKSSYFHGERIDAFGLILNAYNVDLMSRLKNVPGWAKETKFDVTAKSDASTDEALAKLSDRDFEAEKDHMLRGLLADRFKLQIHSEIRQTVVYELVATARTAKLMRPVHGDIARTVSTCDQLFPPKGVEIKSEGCPFTILLSTLSQALDGSVVDHTGLSGMYAFDLGWGPSPLIQHEGREYYPKIQDAIREQLGLEVKKTQGPATFWVVDHIERPTPN